MLTAFARLISRESCCLHMLCTGFTHRYSWLLYGCQGSEFRSLLCSKHFKLLSHSLAPQASSFYISTRSEESHVRDQTLWGHLILTFSSISLQASVDVRSSLMYVDNRYMILIIAAIWKRQWSTWRCMCTMYVYKNHWSFCFTVAALDQWI